MDPSLRKKPSMLASCIAQAFSTITGSRYYQSDVAERRSLMTRSQQPHIDRFDIDHGTNDAPLPRRQSNVQQFTPGFAWNSTTQEFIEILPIGHPDYERNAQILAAAIKRWNGETS
jgi:hypothetical protein